MVQLSPAYLEWKQATFQEGKLEGKLEGELKTVLRQLDRRVGPLSDDRRSQIRALSLHQIEDLADCLLDFTSEADLVTWLQQLADRHAIVTDQLQQRWGHLTADLQTQVQQLSPTQLNRLLETLPQVTSLEGLTNWLQVQLTVD